MPYLLIGGVTKSVMAKTSKGGPQQWQNQSQEVGLFLNWGTSWRCIHIPGHRYADGPQKYVEQRPSASKTNSEIRDVTYFRGPGTTLEASKDPLAQKHPAAESC